MHPQRSFADVEDDGQPRQTRRERLLRRMDALMPWARLKARIRPVYPTGERGRPPVSAGPAAADSLRAAVLQPQRSGDGRRALRQRGGAAVRGADRTGPAAR